MFHLPFCVKTKKIKQPVSAMKTTALQLRRLVLLNQFPLPPTISCVVGGETEQSFSEKLTKRK